ncbi:MAG: CotH kinase family protein, partial [Verrucomicrobiae bacterium]|nr:CotH kinase family protein [Verrucomicrobiae bacterium]
MLRPGRRLRAVLAGAVLLLSAGLLADTVIPLDATWRYFKGTTEASSPKDAWRQGAFDDSAWETGPAPFYYGENVAGGTLITDMRNSYTTLFLRHSFTLANVEDIGSLTLRTAVDDGFIAWLNGHEVARSRVNVTDPSFDDRANSNATEPVEFASYLIANEPGLLVEGPNVLAVQMFNVSLTSSDLQFHADLTSALTDSDPPTVLAVSPMPGGVAELTEITVTFSEAVTGVDADDLWINGIPADTVDARGTSFTFGFAQPPFGTVRVSFDPNHGITDFAQPANGFDETAPNATWSYSLSDSLPPQVVWITPPPGSTVSALGEIEVLFSEPVAGLEATDLWVNGGPATNVTGVLTGPYRFTFPTVDAGVAEVVWADGHGIVDTSEPPNPFVGAGWNYTVDPGFVRPDVVISEFLAANLNGLTDEDGEPQDWIELYNRGVTAANLSGWSLSDEADSPGKWVIPAISLGAGQRLLIFASGKDRHTPGAELHTNFKLGTDGEYLGLFNHEQPRQVISEFTPKYPEQRNDISYGLTVTGEWGYFANPTPRSANGVSAITGVTPGVDFSVKRRFASEPFDLALSCELGEATIRYTLDGSEPTASTGVPYSAPVHLDRTRVVRAAAFASNRLPSKVKTQTYLFIASIVEQPAVPAGFPAQWGSRVVTTGDYEMDPRIVDSAQYADRTRAGLAGIPALSLVMPVDDWFSPATGIYSNGDREGIAWERAASIELILPDGGNGFQEDCGLRIQGGSSTSPWKSYKLSMQARFRSDYGAAWLQESVFKDTPVERFDILIIDAGLNYVWSYGGGSGPSEQRTKAKYLTDQYASDLQLACGDLAVHGRYVNVFVNGLYWGLHNLHEEPEAAFGSTYIGGDKEDYDVIKHTGNNVLDGNAAAWDEMMQTARSGLADPVNYAALAALLDIPAFIDYMLVHFYIGNTDWPHHNWYALRQREPGGKWYFVSWDSEHSLKSVSENRTGVGDSNTCAELYSLLRQNAEFRLLFADRAHRHFFNGGPYYVNPAAPAWDPAHPENNRPAALYNRRVAEIDTALVAESARWGDNQRPDEPYTRDVEYVDTLRELNETYFPQRSAIVLEQLRTASLYPRVVAPVFSQHGGRVNAGFRLALSAPAGALWYTTDGSDPRVAGSGDVAPSATEYTAPLPAFAGDTLVKARVLADGAWSALTEATFQLAGPALRLLPTELMYHASGGGEYEFLEMVNLGAWPLDLSAFSFNGIDYVFPPAASPNR